MCKGLPLDSDAKCPYEGYIPMPGTNTCIQGDLAKVHPAYCTEGGAYFLSILNKEQNDFILGRDFDV